MLNVKSDRIIGEHAKTPKKFHIHNTPSAAYIGTKFIQNHFAKEIRRDRGQMEAERHTLKQHGYSKETLNNIE